MTDDVKSDGELREQRERRAEVPRLWLESLSPERRQAFRTMKTVYNRRWFEGLPPERKAEYRERQNVYRDRFEARLGPEEFARRTAAYRQTYAEKRRRRQRSLRAARARAAEWDRAHPDRVRERQKRYRLANIERVRAAGRDYYDRNRDAIRQRRLDREDPQKVAEQRRRYQANYVRKRPPTWKPSGEQRAAYYKAHADRRRLARRLAAAGLPPRNLQVVSASQRRANDRAAADFFARRWSLSEVRAARQEDVATPPALYAQFVAQWRVDRMRVKIAAAARAQLRRNGRRLREEVEMDSRARILRGAPPLDPEVEVYRRLADLVRAGYPKLASAHPPFAIVPPSWAAPPRPNASADLSRE